MNDELMLVEPSEEYFAELAAYRNDFLENSDSMDGCGPLRRFDDMKAYLEDTMRYTREETLPEGMVLATQFLCIRKSDNRLVGMSSRTAKASAFPKFWSAAWIPTKEAAERS